MRLQERKKNMYATINTKTNFPREELWLIISGIATADKLECNNWRKHHGLHMIRKKCKI